MRDFEIIDAHIHLATTGEEEENQWIFPGRSRFNRWGTPERAVNYMDNNGILKSAFMIMLPRYLSAPFMERKRRLLELPAEQRRKELEGIGEQISPLIRRYNQWGCEVGAIFPRLLPFVFVSDDLGRANVLVEEVVLGASRGAKGVKLHPSSSHFFPDDEIMWPMYEKCQELGLPVLADSAPPINSFVWTAYRWQPQIPQVLPDYGEPKNFAKVLEAFPRLTLILAHLGSAWWDERVELAQKYSNVYFDTSQGFSAPDRTPVCPHRGLAEEDAPRIMRRIGVDRIMFGTDSPGISPQPQLEQILRISLRDEEKKMVLADNAKRILRI